VFHAKVNHLLHNLKKKQIFGVYRGSVWIRRVHFWHCRGYLLFISLYWIEKYNILRVTTFNGNEPAIWNVLDIAQLIGSLAKTLAIVRQFTTMSLLKWTKQGDVKSL
jgi:hypothetical protein